MKLRVRRGGVRQMALRSPHSTYRRVKNVGRPGTLKRLLDGGGSSMTDTGPAVEAVGSMDEDHPDFDSFYESSRDRIYRALAIALGDADLAAEATDEAMTRAVERWSAIGRYDNPQGWVYRVGLNCGRSRQRRRRANVFARLHAAPASYEMTLPDPELIEAVARLPIRYRSVIVARYYLQWTPQEIANAMELPASTVRSRLQRALARLRKGIGDS